MTQTQRLHTQTLTSQTQTKTHMHAHTRIHSPCSDIWIRSRSIRTQSAMLWRPVRVHRGSALQICSGCSFRFRNRPMTQHSVDNYDTIMNSTKGVCTKKRKAIEASLLIAFTFTNQVSHCLLCGHTVRRDRFGGVLHGLTQSIRRVRAREEGRERKKED